MSLAQHRLLKSTDAAFSATTGISATQLGVLFVLENMPGALPTQVSEALGINKSAITALIGRMEEAGLVQRKRSDADGRAVCLFATPQGLAKARAARPVLASLNERLTRDFTEQEIATVARFLKSILERF
jgi:DNA-binding MarR family transcriptional regulator